MKELSKQTIRHLRKEDEQIEVSFAILTIDRSNYSQIIQKIATIINVQLSTEAGQNLLPFVPPKAFENAVRRITTIELQN